MTIPKEAVELAISGGYVSTRAMKQRPYGFIPNGQYKVALDTTFWQALGKALGWGKTDNCWGCGYDEGATIDTYVWFVNAHKFYDLILTNQPTEAFWQSILTAKD